MGTYMQQYDCKHMFFLEVVEDPTCDRYLGHHETFSSTVHLCGDGVWEDLLVG